MTIFLLQAGAVRDTVFVVQQKPGWQHWVEALAAVAQIVLALALLAVGLGLLFAALKVKALMKKLEEQGQKLRVDLGPAIQNVTTVTENASEVSKAVRKDVDRLSASVTAATEKLKGAAEMAEQRVGEFNALIGVVQEEAEQLFIGGAATLRGVRAGSETFRRFRSGELEYLGEVTVEEDDDADFDDDDGYDEDDADEIEVELRRGPAGRGRDGDG
ncbi:MAG TPA: hypothetical protein VM890_01410 [Longimicrobium sp.]|nr:hypothetical protein [Longimicrobium sp.]